MSHSGDGAPVPPVETQINNQAHPLNVPPLPFCSWQVVAGDCMVRISLKGKSKMFILFQYGSVFCLVFRAKSCRKAQ